MTGSESALQACGLTCDLGTCTLPAGHTLGHQDESKQYAQWWDRSTASEPGAYSSIQPGDKAWRHSFGQCNGPYPPRKGQMAWCSWCLREALRDLYETGRDPLVDRPVLLIEEMLNV